MNSKLSFLSPYFTANSHKLRWVNMVVNYDNQDDLRKRVENDSSTQTSFNLQLELLEFIHDSVTRTLKMEIMPLNHSDQQ